MSACCDLQGHGSRAAVAGVAGVYPPRVDVSGGRSGASGTRSLSSSRLLTRGTGDLGDSLTRVGVSSCLAQADVRHMPRPHGVSQRLWPAWRR